LAGPIDPLAELQDAPARRPVWYHDGGTQGASKRSERYSYNVCAPSIAIFRE